MRFATEVIDLMAAFPGRNFRMQQLVRYVESRSTGSSSSRPATKKAVARVVAELQRHGSVVVTPAAKAGSFAEYRWCA